MLWRLQFDMFQMATAGTYKLFGTYSIDVDGVSKPLDVFTSIEVVVTGKLHRISSTLSCTVRS